MGEHPRGLHRFPPLGRGEGGVPSRRSADRVRHGGADSRPDRGSRSASCSPTVVFYPDRETQAERDRFQIPLLYPLLRRKYFLDDLYWVGIVQPIKGPIARGVNWINTYVIDGIVNGVAAVTMVLSRFVYRDSTRAGSTESSARSGRDCRCGRVRPCDVFKPGGYSSMRAESWWVRWRWCWRSWFSDRRGTDTDGTVERMGPHPGGVPPRPRGAGHGCDSQVERECHQAVWAPWWPSSPSCSRWSSPSISTTAGRVGLSVRSQSFLDQRDQCQLPRRHRWDQPPSL